MTGMLGKKPYVKDPRSLQFAKYATALPAPPPAVNWDHNVPTWPMFLNDSLGCCTRSCEGHMIQLWTAAVGAEALITDTNILLAYERDGYVPGDPSTDQGAEIKAVLADWQKIGMAGHTLLAYTEVAYTNVTLMEQAINLLGAVDVGVQLPLAAQQMGQHWTTPPVDPTPKPKKRHEWWQFWEAKEHPAVTEALSGQWTPGSWGGHSIPFVDYDHAAQTFTCISWGELIVVDYGFAAAYLDEAWACLSTDFISAAGTDPQGFDLPTLQTDLGAL